MKETQPRTSRKDKLFTFRVAAEFTALMDDLVRDTTLPKSLLIEMAVRLLDKQFRAGGLVLAPPKTTTAE